MPHDLFSTAPSPSKKKHIYNNLKPSPLDRQYKKSTPCKHINFTLLIYFQPSLPQKNPQHFPPPKKNVKDMAVAVGNNNLAVVPHSCLEKADVRTRKKHSQKFRHIGYNIDPYGQSFFPNCISAWNGLAKDIAEANTLDIFKSKLQN